MRSCKTVELSLASTPRKHGVKLVGAFLKKIVSKYD